MEGKAHVYRCLSKVIRQLLGGRSVNQKYRRRKLIYSLKLSAFHSEI